MLFLSFVLYQMSNKNNATILKGSKITYTLQTCINNGKKSTMHKQVCTFCFKINHREYSPCCSTMPDMGKKLLVVRDQFNCKFYQYHCSTNKNKSVLTNHIHLHSSFLPHLRGKS